MNGSSNALRYLVARSTANWFRRQLGRLRQPRYALATVVALGYFALVLLMPAAPKPSADAASTINALTSIALLLALAAPWLLREGTALALTPAEVTLLFAAPLTRRQLIAYRLSRSQLILLVNGLIWSVLLRRYAVGAPWIARFLVAWGALALIVLHQMLIALLRVRPRTLVRNVVFRVGQLAASAALLSILIGIAPLLTDPHSRSLVQIPATLRHLRTDGPSASILGALDHLLAPIRPLPVATQLLGFGALLLLIILHVVVIVTLDVPFEDQVTAASARRATTRARVAGMRSGRLIVSAKTSSRLRLPLAAKGSPILAFGWKNSVALLRSQSGRMLPISIGVILVLMRIGSGGHPVDGPPPWLGYATVGGMLISFGPRMLRNDLREDLAHLAALRTWPLSGREIVIGEILSPAAVLSGAQLIFAALALQATVLHWPEDPEQIGAAGVLLLAGSVAIVAINLMNIGLQNGLALLYPGWVRIGIDAGGIEAFGQTVLAATSTLLALVLSLVGPAALLAAGIWISRSLGGILPMVGVAIAAIPAVTLLVIEVIVLIGALGRLLERTEPKDVG